MGSREYSPRGRSMSISPEPYSKRDSPNYRSRSGSRSPNYRRRNGYHKKSRKFIKQFLLRVYLPIFKNNLHLYDLTIFRKS